MKCVAIALLLLGCKKTAPLVPSVDLGQLIGSRLDSPHPIITAFQAVSNDATTRDPADLMGQPTVMWFFPAANTSGCTIEGCGYRDLHADFESLGVAIVGVTFTSVESNAEWVTNLEFPYEIWHDTDRALATHYRAVDGPEDKWARRRTRVLNRDGEVVLEYNDSIIVGAHPAEVLADVRTLVAAGLL